MAWIGVVGCSDDGAAGDDAGTAATGSASADDADDGTAADGASGSASDADGASADGTGAAGDGVGETGDGSGSECQGDRDCPDGVCVELVEGGVRVCISPVVEAKACPKDPGGKPPPHECCDSSECEAGICVDNQVGPACSGAQPFIYNVCVADMCTSHDDCVDNQACIPAGALSFPVATCWAVECLQDADCVASPGGVCAIVPTTTCCNDVLPRCRYPDSPPITDECPP